MRGAIKPLLILTVFVMATLFYGMPSVGRVSAQGKAVLTVSGVVVDSLTGEPVPMITVGFSGEKRRGSGDMEGRFIHSASKRRSAITVEAMGYAPMRLKLPSGQSVVFLDTIRLVPEVATLQEVVVKPKKARYSKRNNPAVDFVNKLRGVSRDYDPTLMPLYSFDKYEKIVLGMLTGNNSHPDSLVTMYMDYSPATGNPYFTLSLKEKRSKVMYCHGTEREVVEGYTSAGVDENFNTENMRRIFEDILREVDVYQGQIALLQNRFVSPLSAIGPDYYKYYLNDTVLIQGEPCIQLSFGPHNRESLGFAGRIFVPLDDTTMFIRKVVMHVPPAANLNYVKDLQLVQTFERDSLGNRHKISDQVTVELQILPGTPSLYARRETTYGAFSYDTVPAPYGKYLQLEGREHFLEHATERDARYWSSARLGSLTGAQVRMADMMKELRKKKWIYWGEKVLMLLEKGYVGTGSPSRVDLGPLNTLVSFNDVEGVRLRVGGMTTAWLSKRFFMRGYGAYGTRDHRFKGGGELEYSFVDKKYHSREWPMHAVRLSASYDLDQIGQHYLFTNTDNIFLSLKRAPSDKVTYRLKISADYILERRSGFALEAGFSWQRQTQSRWLPFTRPDGLNIKSYTQAAFRLKLSYSPDQQFYQMASMRLPINLDAPIFILTQEYGPKGLLGADFTYNKTELSAQKRFWLSMAGYMDVILKGAKVWSGVYYPALPWPNANLSYTIQPESFALMNPMEFAIDQYVGWDLTYWLNGLVLNRIPFINKARLREVVCFRGCWGSLTKRNDPVHNPGLLAFPEDVHVGRMTSTPYMEVSVGITNIFTVLRLDYVWRLTYRDTPGADRHGLRLSLQFSF